MSAPFDAFAAVAEARELAGAAGILPRAGIILGSGLGPLADALTVAASHESSKLPHFPRSTAPGHHGRLLFGTLGTVPVAVFQGRLHVYEGVPLPVAALTARVLCGLGVDLLVVTNAAGGLRAEWEPGDVMVIRDHVNLLGGSPLEGANDSRLGVRFPDLSDVYPEDLRRIAAPAVAARGLAVREGVYAAVRGPQYETPAEIRMLGLLGADAVGMSTVPEAIVAAHQRTPVLGLSVVTNWAAGVRPAEQATIDQDEVLDVGRDVSPRLAAAVSDALPALVAAARARRARREGP